MNVTKDGFLTFCRAYPHPFAMVGAKEDLRPFLNTVRTFDPEPIILWIFNDDGISALEKDLKIRYNVIACIGHWKSNFSLTGITRLNGCLRKLTF